MKIDSNKVIEGLDCIVNDNVHCETCGYSNNGHYSSWCKIQIHSDALDLAKEQAEIIKEQTAKIDRRKSIGWYTHWGNRLLRLRY